MSTSLRSIAGCDDVDDNCFCLVSEIDVRQCSCRIVFVSSNVFYPFQDLGFGLSNALQSDIVFQIVVTFSFSNFFKSRNNPFLTRHFLTLSESEVTFAFPVLDQRIDFLDAMSPRWLNESTFSSSSTTSSSILITDLKFQESTTNGLNDNLVAENLVNHIAQARPEMLLFEELLLRHSTESTSGRRKSAKFRSRLDLKREIILSVGLSPTCDEAMKRRVLCELLNLNVGSVEENNPVLELSDPFSRRRCLVFLRSCAESVSASGFFIELVSASAEMLFVLRELMTRRLAGEAGIDCRVVAVSVKDQDSIRMRIKDLGEVHKNLRQIESCASGDVRRLLLETTLQLMGETSPM